MLASSEVTALAGAAVQLAAATVLVAAAAGKAAAPRGMRATLGALHLDLPVVLPVLVASELAIALALAAAPTAPVTMASVAGLGLVFALVGLSVHRRGEVVACACFGPTPHRLGLRQVAALPLWCGAAVGPRLAGSTLAGRSGVLALAGATTAVAVVAAAPVLRHARSGQARARMSS